MNSFEDLHTSLQSIGKRRLIFSGMAILFSEIVSARAFDVLSLSFIESWFQRKTEEYQEEYLLNLAWQYQEELLRIISKSFPEMHILFQNPSLKKHLLRVGYIRLYLQNFPISSSNASRSILSAEDILIPSDILLGPVAVGNSSYRVRLPRMFQKNSLEPFDIISPENRAIVINGTYGVYDNEICQELTIDGKPTGRYLLLSHGDYVEIPTLPFNQGSREKKDDSVNNFLFPRAIVDSRWMRLCSQVARELGESVWKNFSRGKSALHSLSLYGKNMPRFTQFDAIPAEYMIADVFMKSAKNPEFGHRAFAFRKDNNWYLADPYSHKEIVSSGFYRRRGDIISIVAFR